MFEFAVLGDIHYTRKECYEKVFQGKRGYPEETEDINRYLYSNEHSFLKIMEELREYADIDFIVGLGDLIQGCCDTEELTCKEIKKALDIFSKLKKPFYLAKGNHDDHGSFEKIAIPQISNFLNDSLNENCYSFEKFGNKFIILDSQKPNYYWLEQELKSSKNYKHTFLFSHKPIFAVSRAFFTDKSFADKLKKLLAQYPVDCFFAGHAHDQSFSLHSIDNNDVLQMVVSSLGYPTDSPIPLTAVRNIILGEKEKFFDGFLEGTAPSWLLIKVKAETVIIEHRVVGKGVSGIFELTKEEGISYNRNSTTSSPEKITEEDFKNIRYAELHMAMHDACDANKKVFLNGTAIGYLPVSSTYSPHAKIIISEKLFQSIKTENKILITNPKGEEYTIGSIYLELNLMDGRLIRTELSQNIFAYTNKWTDWNVEILRQMEPSKEIEFKISFHGHSIDK